MRLTDESNCVVSFVSGSTKNVISSSQSYSLPTNTNNSNISIKRKDNLPGEETPRSCPPITCWFNRLVSNLRQLKSERHQFNTNTTSNTTKRKRSLFSRLKRKGEGVGRGGGGGGKGERHQKRTKDMFWRYLFDFMRGLLFLFKQIVFLSKRKVIEHQSVRYPVCPLSPSLEARLFSVKRKIMVLDLDETLIHSHHDNSAATPTVDMVPDFYVRVFIDNHPVKFYVYKRPHVDYFLSVICQWYDLVVFTASMQKYGMEVANHLDQNKGILPRRYFRQDCTVDMNGYTKNLSMISEDMGNIFILDNSPSAYRSNPDNAIPITSWFSDPLDTDLLDLLPFLDSLRFTTDVRSVLSRNLHQHSLW